MQVSAIKAFNDNYIWAIYDDQHLIVVDPGDPAPVQSFIKRRKLKLTAILVTHHHHDHTGGIATILEQHPEVEVYGPALEQIAHCQHYLKEGDQITFSNPDCSFQIMEIPGHTLGHRAEGQFEFNYHYPAEVLEKYISFGPDNRPRGIFMDFYDHRKEDFIPIYSSVAPELPIDEPLEGSVSPYAVIKGDTKVGLNVLVAQRAYIENSSLGDGANAQENCYIINSTYEGMDITAHGGKVIHSRLGRKVFVGFNSFLNGKEDARISIGRDSIVMPHTIIDTEEPVSIPDGSLVWGYIRRQEDLVYRSSLN